MGANIFHRVGMEVVDGMHVGQIRGAWSHVGRCWSISRVQIEDIDDTRSHRTALGRVEPELFALPGKALTQDATTRLHFVVYTAGCLLSMDAVLVLRP